MFKWKLRTKFLLSLLLISASLTWATLLIVRQRVQLNVRDEIFQDLRNSVVTFQSLERQREEMLARSAELLANLPPLKAVMTTRHEATIQDTSADFWRLSGSDLFILADPTGKLMALHPATPGLTRSDAQEFLSHSLRNAQARDWWYGSGHLFEVFLQPIYFGSRSDNTLLGVLATGYEIDDRVARDVSRLSACRVAFRYGKTIVVSTLSASQQAELRRSDPLLGPESPGPADVQLAGERFLATSVALNGGQTPTVSLSVLKSYDQAAAFLDSLNRWILGVGLAAVLAGSALVFLISYTFTRPLANLVAGVHALEKGDFGFPLGARGQDELSELTAAFTRMRRTLQQTQQELLQAERLAIIGRMASTISHDLRHPLSAILAFAEFLSGNNLNDHQREDAYQEVRLAVDRMTEQISSLLGFSKGREALRPVYGDMNEVIERAVQAVRARPEFRSIAIKVSHEGACESHFDPLKMESVFHNLVLNACEAVAPDSGKVEITARQTGQGLDILVADNGPGIPQDIRASLFQPFVSSGKENGIGLGLTVVQKIILDHGGDIGVAGTGPDGTTFQITLPATLPAGKIANA